LLAGLIAAAVISIILACMFGRLSIPMSSVLQAFLIKAGLPRVRFHDLRHAHATLMLQQGVHPKIVSERLGHASIGITLDTYPHVLPSMQQDAADAFDEIFAE